MPEELYVGWREMPDVLDELFGQRLIIWRWQVARLLSQLMRQLLAHLAIQHASIRGVALHTLPGVVDRVRQEDILDLGC